MADANIKKIVIDKRFLPDASGSTNTVTYNVRYRLISEDKNRFSHWSKIYNINALASSDSTSTPVSLVPDLTLAYSYIKETQTTATGTIKSIKFNWVIPVSYKYTSFDIFVKRDPGGVFGNYEYYGTSYTNSYSIVDTGTTHVQVLVQIPTYPKEISTYAKLFETASINI